MPPLDESMSADYIGKTILVGVTYLDRNEKLLTQKQWTGVIQTFSNREGIKIKDTESGTVFCLPPDDAGLRPAPPGSYRLRSSGVVFENPDYLATWTCVKSERE